MPSRTFIRENSLHGISQVLISKEIFLLKELVDENIQIKI